jgi:tyrosyl-tRNA synthetase
MSKTFENTVDILMPPFEMFSRIMSMSDDILPMYYEVLTDVPLAEIAEIRTALAAGSINPMELKKRLAREIVSQFHTPADGPAAEDEWVRRFSKREVPDEMPEHGISTPTAIVDVMVAASLASSKSEARRLIDGGGVRANGEKVEAYDFVLAPGEPIILQVGRRKFVRVVALV